LRMIKIRYTNNNEYIMTASMKDEDER